MGTQKHLHLARRKMSHVVDKIYTALLLAGCREVSLRIVREEEGLRLWAEGDFDWERRDELARLERALHPAVRSPAMVEEFWDLDGGEQYASDGELSLVGQMAEVSDFRIRRDRVTLELLVPY